MTSLNIGLLWHSIDSANLGVGALTYSQIYLIGEAAYEVGVEVEFIIIGWAQEISIFPDKRIIEVCQVNAKRLLGVDPQLHASIAKCDLLFDISEGDSFSDIYGWKRLIYLAGTKLLASRGGRPLVLSPQTLGPFRRPLAAWLGDIAMTRARAVCSRDALSTNYFHSRRLKTPFHEVIDVAFALPFVAMPKDGIAIRVGINVSGLLWAGGYSGNNQFRLKLDYRATLQELIEYFSAQPNVEVVLVPHVVTASREAEDDLRVSMAIAAIRSKVRVAGPFGTPMEAKSFISGLDFFVGARMHACIAAFSAGVPSVPMAYSRKFTGLFNTLEYTHVADCTQEDQASVVSRVVAAFSCRRQLAAETLRGNEIARQRLTVYRQLLVGLLRDVARG